MEEVGERHGATRRRSLHLLGRHEGRFERMTSEIPGDGASPREGLAQAALLYGTAADAFALVLDGTRAGGGPEAAREAMGYAREFRQALVAVLNERASVEKLRRDSEGIAPGRELDFERARAEIGRRLACLRDAGDGG